MPVRRLVRGAAICAVLVVVVVLSQPFLAAGANNRLEQRCSALATWTYDRSHHVPLFWTCTGQTLDGQKVTLRPW